MKIVHVTETAISGVATFLRIFAEAKPCGWDNVFVVPDGQRENIGPIAHSEPYPGKDRGGALTLAMIRAALAARKDHAPDLMVFHSSFSLLALAAVRAAGYRGPALYIPHSWSISMFEDKSAAKARLVRLVEGNLARLADAVVNVSDAERAMVGALGYGGRQEMIENPALPTDADARSDMFADEPDAVHLLFVGRFDRQKAYDLLLEGFAAARAQRPDLRLHLIGGHVRTQDARALPEGASVVGWVAKDDIDDYYRSADALIIPSRWEGLPIVIPEALANGTPVLCSRRSGMDTLIEPGVTGEHFECDARGIEKCLVALDKDNLKARRAAAKASYEQRFSIARWRGQMEALITDVVAGKAAR